MLYSHLWCKMELVTIKQFKICKSVGCDWETETPTEDHDKHLANRTVLINH